MNRPGLNSMAFSWDSQKDDVNLDHFEVYFNKGQEASPDSYGAFSTYVRTYTGNNLIRGEGKILDRLGVQAGDTVYITLYAVNVNGVKSEAVKVSTVYLPSNN